jgi:hypothetical protein
MLAADLHLASGPVVVPLDDLTVEDLQHLIALKRTEAERQRVHDAEDLERALWQIAAKMPKDAAASIRGQLSDDISPRVVLRESWDRIYAARFGASVPALGAYLAGVTA